MNPDVFLHLGASLFKVSLFMAMAIGLILCLHRAEPRWRVLGARVAYITLPILLVAAVCSPRILVPYMPLKVLFEAETQAPDHLMLERKFEIDPQTKAVTVSGQINRSSGSSESLVAALVVAWLLTALAFSLREAWRLRQFGPKGRHLRYTQPAPQQAQGAWDTICRDYGVRACCLRISVGNESPWLSPSLSNSNLVIPACLLETMEEDGGSGHLEHVFRHEAAHLAHRDPVWILIARFTTCLFWFHPLAWWLEGLHLRSAEEASDAEAARRGGDATAYSSALANLALQLIPQPLPATALLRIPSVSRRLRKVGHHARLRPPASWKARSLACVLTLSGVVAGTLEFSEPASSAGDPEQGGLSNKLKRIILPEAEFTDLPLKDALEFIQQRARELDPEKEGFNLVYDPSAESLLDAPVNLKLSQIPVTEVIRYATQLAGAIFQIEENAVVIKAKPKPALADGWEKPSGSLPGTALGRKMASVVIPQIKLEEVPLRDALVLLQQQSRQQDPEKKGIHFILDPSAEPRQDALITLKLTQVPVAEALRYITQLGGVAYVTEADSVRILSLEKIQELEAFASPRDTSPGSASAESMAAKVDLFQRLMDTRIPLLEFRESSLEDAIKFIQQKAVELDPDKRAVNVVFDPSVEKGVTRKITCSFRNVSLMKAFGFATEVTGLSFEISDNSVLILQPPASANTAENSRPPLSEADYNAAGIYTRVYALPKSAFDLACQQSGKSSAKEVLEHIGVRFPPYSNAIYNSENGHLILRVHQRYYPQIEAWIDSFKAR